MGPMQGARITRLAAVAGEVVPGIRTLDIPGSAITAWATAIRMPAIMVTDPVGAMIHIAGIILAGLILTDTGTRLTWASALGPVATEVNQHHQRELGRSNAARVLISHAGCTAPFPYSFKHGDDESLDFSP